MTAREVNEQKKGKWKRESSTRNEENKKNNETVAVQINYPQAHFFTFV